MTRRLPKEFFDRAASGGLTQGQVESWKNYSQDSKAARTRSEKLLRAVCTEVELRDWDRAGYVWVRGPLTKRWYSVSFTSIAVWTSSEDGPPDESHIQRHVGYRCIIPAAGAIWNDRRERGWNMTILDLIIARKLLIQCNERHFLRLSRDHAAIRDFMG